MTVTENEMWVIFTHLKLWTQLQVCENVNKLT